MRMHQIGKVAPKSVLFLSICLFLLAACGSNTSTTSTGATSSGTSATATACAQTTRPATAFKTAIGLLKSISGQTLTLANTQGTDVTVTYSSSTTFTQEVKLAPGDLKEGASVRVTVTSSGSTYTAMSVLVSTGTSTSTGGFGGFGGFGGLRGTPGAGRGTGTNPCAAARGRFGNGTPAAGNSSFRGLVGTISQVNGSILVITDTTGASYTVNMTAQTQIVETKSATSAALAVGEPLTAVGKPGSQGAIAASTIAILLSLPTRGTPKATPTA